MNPLTLLQSRGWNIDRFKIKRANDQWKLTLTDQQKIGDYTANYIIQSIEDKYTVVRYVIKNAAPHTIYYVGMPKDKNYLTIWFVERPEIESHLWYVSNQEYSLIRCDLDYETAEQVAKDYTGVVFYSPMVLFPCPDPRQYQFQYAR